MITSIREAQESIICQETRKGLMEEMAFYMDKAGKYGSEKKHKSRQNKPRA